MSFTAVTQNAWKFQPDVENKSGNLGTVHENHPRSCHRARGRLYPKQVTSSVAGPRKSLEAQSSHADTGKNIRSVYLNQDFLNLLSVPQSDVT